jgi:hypothetical protein
MLPLLMLLLDLLPLLPPASAVLLGDADGWPGARS